MTRLLWLILALPALVAPGAAAQQRTLTLREAIDLAAQVNPEVVRAGGGIRSAGAGVLEAKGSFFPSLTATSSGNTTFSEGPQRIDAATGQVISGNITTKSVGFGLNAGLDLFTGFRRGAALRAANATRDGAQATYTVQAAQSALQTSRQFFEALSQAELIRVREESLQREEEKLRIAAGRLATRATTISDSLNAVVSLADARLQLLTQQSLLAAAEANLARFVGLDGRVAARDDPTLHPTDTPVDTTAIYDLARRSAPAVLEAEAAVRTSQAQLSASKASYWPTLSLNASTNYSASDRTSYELFNTRSVGFSVSWPLFNRFTRERQVVAARITHETNVARAEDARRQVLAQVAAQIAALRTAQERISVTRLAVDAARANVRVQVERYQLGSISIEDLGNAQAALNRAEEQAVIARFDFLRARAEIEAILGQPLP